MDFQVEKNVPVPEVYRGGGRTAKYPYAAMSAGDSFFVPATDCPPKTVQQSAAAYGRRHKILFESRRMSKTINGVEVQGLRVWKR